jgi:hypothetical protein
LNKLQIVTPIGRGCYLCGREKIYNSQATSKIDFIKQANQIHNFKYDYSLVNYKNCDTKIKIICPFHGAFEQTPYQHLKGHGCHKCGILISGKNRRHLCDDFIIKSSKIHNNKYDYSLVSKSYITKEDKVPII